MKKLEAMRMNTGGNVMVDYYPVSKTVELKWIGISDDAIVGYSIDEPWNAGGGEDELWYIDTTITKK
jgi:hypothetical protein